MRSCRVLWAAPVQPASAPHLFPLLDPHERTRLARFRRAGDAARYLAAHALTRLVLGAALDRAPAELVFDRTCRCGEQHGKPTLADGPAFSVTHSGSLVGLAVHVEPVGLDVEEVRTMTDLESMREHVLSPTEATAAAAAAPDGPGFFSVWTRKEAVLKATGDGLSAPMNVITLGAAGVVEWTGDTAPRTPVWVHELHPAPGHVGAVAGLGAAPPVVVEDGNVWLH